MLYDALGVSLFTGGTESNLEAISTRSEITAQPNPNFPFGDYVAGLQAIAGMLWDTISGGVVGDMLLDLQGSDILSSPAVMLFRLLYSFASACLVLNILTGRDL